MENVTREVKDIDIIEDLLRSARVCRIAVNHGESPYIIPMCFGYTLTGGKLELYFRFKINGEKASVFKSGAEAAFEIDELTDVKKSDGGFGFDISYGSIVGKGPIEFVNGVDKLTGLSLILSKYLGKDNDGKLSEQALNSYVMLKITADEFCCKIRSPEQESKENL